MVACRCATGGVPPRLWWHAGVPAACGNYFCSNFIEWDSHLPSSAIRKIIERWTGARPSARACGFGRLEGFHHIGKRLSVAQSCTTSTIAKPVQLRFERERPRGCTTLEDLFQDGLELGAEPRPFFSGVFNPVPTARGNAEENAQE
jgi:hypothetical protein